MAGPSSIVFPLRVAVLERLWGQPFDGLNYEKESGVIKTRGFQISVPKRSITLATSNNLGPPTLIWLCGLTHTETTLLDVKHFNVQLLHATLKR
jgi:hypothetical protein